MSITSQCTGQVLEAKTASFQDDNGQSVAYGKIQLLCPDMSGDFHQIQNIKVKTENFGWLPDIAQLKGKEVTLHLDQSQYQGRVSYYLAAPLELKKAS